MFADAMPLGIERPVGGLEGSATFLNPYSELSIEEGDRIIVLAEDDDT